MMATVGIPGMLVYVVVIPTFIALVLKRQNLALTLYPSQKNYQSKWTLRFGFMFAGYREGYEWWETVVLLRKCFFVLLAIFLKQYGPAPQVVAASLILVFALSAQLQNLPYQDKEHDKIERIGIQACLLQLQVALLCNLIRDQPASSASASDLASLGPKSTVLLIFIVFGSTLYFFLQTIRATIQGSQETPGPVGFLARSCGDRCGKRSAEEEEEKEEKMVEKEDEQTQKTRQIRIRPILSRFVTRVVRHNKVEIIKTTAEKSRRNHRELVENRKKDSQTRLSRRLLNRKKKKTPKVMPLKLSPTPQQQQAHVAVATDFDMFVIKVGTKLTRVKPVSLFKKLDTDQSGGLSPREFHKLLMLVDQSAITKEIFSECWRMALVGNTAGGGEKEMSVDEMTLWIQKCAARAAAANTNRLK